ncbi:metal-dependent hydrolase [Halorussus amylolyticus]|uniref:metal-dependent hydrolase n=1 Tax=Halorussus amylolyticus TaxID=1126242 RepID=UPI00192F42DC|nr:metal-dependent hydrolase [Halorussus amylolyticus]
MMGTTHALVGVFVATAVAQAIPEFGPVALAAAVIGSVFPDFDLYSGHRKTLHFPVYYSILAVPALALALAAPGTATVAVGLFLVGAALHSTMDALGGGLELEPWRETSEKAVYDHYRSRWVAPRRWIRYDGAPEDLGFAALLAAPALALHDAPIRWFVLAVLAVSAGYTLLRKPLAKLWAAVVPMIPHGVRPYVPERFHETDEDGRGRILSDAD